MSKFKDKLPYGEVVGLLYDTPYFGINVVEEGMDMRNVEADHIDTLLRMYRSLIARGLLTNRQEGRNEALMKILLAPFGRNLEDDLEAKGQFVKLLTSKSTMSMVTFSLKLPNSTAFWEKLLLAGVNEEHPVIDPNQFVLSTRRLPASTKPCAVDLQGEEKHNVDRDGFFSKGPMWELEEEINKIFKPRAATLDVLICDFPLFFKVTLSNGHRKSNGDYGMPPASFKLHAFFSDDGILNQKDEIYEVVVIWRKQHDDVHDDCIIIDPLGKPVPVEQKQGEPAKEPWCIDGGAESQVYILFYRRRTGHEHSPKFTDQLHLLAAGSEAGQKGVYEQQQITSNPSPVQTRPAWSDPRPSAAGNKPQPSSSSSHRLQARTAGSDSRNRAAGNNPQQRSSNNPLQSKSAGLDSRTKAAGNKPQQSSSNTPISHGNTGAASLAPKPTRYMGFGDDPAEQGSPRIPTGPRDDGRSQLLKNARSNRLGAQEPMIEALHNGASVPQRYPAHGESHEQQQMHSPRPAIKVEPGLEDKAVPQRYPAHGESHEQQQMHSPRPAIKVEPGLEDKARPQSEMPPEPGFSSSRKRKGKKVPYREPMTSEKAGINSRNERVKTEYHEQQSTGYSNANPVAKEMSEFQRDFRAPVAGEMSDFQKDIYANALLLTEEDDLSSGIDLGPAGEPVPREQRFGTQLMSRVSPRGRAPKPTNYMGYGQDPMAEEQSRVSPTGRAPKPTRYLGHGEDPMPKEQSRVSPPGRAPRPTRYLGYAQDPKPEEQSRVSPPGRAPRPTRYLGYAQDPKPEEQSRVSPPGRAPRPTRYLGYAQDPKPEEQSRVSPPGRAPRPTRYLGYGQDPKPEEQFLGARSMSDIAPARRSNAGQLSLGLSQFVTPQPQETLRIAPPRPEHWATWELSHPRAPQIGQEIWRTATPQAEQSSLRLSQMRTPQISQENLAIPRAVSTMRGTSQNGNESWAGRQGIEHGFPRPLSHRSSQPLPRVHRLFTSGDSSTRPRCIWCRVGDDHDHDTEHCPNPPGSAVYNARFRVPDYSEEEGKDGMGE